MHKSCDNCNNSYSIQACTQNQLCNMSECYGDGFPLWKPKKESDIKSIDGTKMVVRDINAILEQYPMCDLAIDKNLLLILDHTGFIIKAIKIQK